MLVIYNAFRNKNERLPKAMVSLSDKFLQFLNEHKKQDCIDYSITEQSFFLKRHVLFRKRHITSQKATEKEQTHAFCLKHRVTGDSPNSQFNDVQPSLRVNEEWECQPIKVSATNKIETSKYTIEYSDTQEWNEWIEWGVKIIGWIMIIMLLTIAGVILVYTYKHSIGEVHYVIAEQEVN